MLIFIIGTPVQKLNGNLQVLNWVVGNERKGMGVLWGFCVCACPMAVFEVSCGHAWGCEGWVHCVLGCDLWGYGLRGRAVGNCGVWGSR